MEVILLKDIDKLGKMSDIVRVKDGYAANFLIPRKLAKRVTRKSVKFLEDEKKKAAGRLRKLKDGAERLKERMANVSCTIAVSAGEDEKLHGTVTAEMISDAYRREDIEIDKRQIQLDGHINKLGVYNVGVKLHPEVTASVKVWVVRK